MIFRVGEIGTAITWLVRDESGAPINVTGATCTATFVFSNGDELEVAVPILVAADGTFRYVIASGVCSAARIGDFRLQATYVLGGRTKPLSIRGGTIAPSL